MHTHTYTCPSFSLLHRGLAPSWHRKCVFPTVKWGNSASLPLLPCATREPHKSLTASLLAAEAQRWSVVVMRAGCHVTPVRSFVGETDHPRAG